ncbi:alpha/beta hydrolase [Roseiconus lacunae]|nr:alpha/beta hydrolase [Roseiconus lacunae]
MLNGPCLLGQHDDLSPPPRTAEHPKNKVEVQPCNLSGRLKGEIGWITVPENRRDESSRTIKVNFLRFPARDKTELPAVFVLPGGPGQVIGLEDLGDSLRRHRYSLAHELEEFNRKRDVVVVNQRGSVEAPGIQSLPKYWIADAAPWRLPMSFERSQDRLTKGLKATLNRCGQLNIDIRGYDIEHLVEDVDQLRRAFAYDQIALRGSSFGSQWALAYNARYPKRVDRMVFSGVEPVDHGYDSATGVWSVFERIEDQLEAAETVDVPEIGLLGAVKETIARLEENPVKVVGYHPRKGYEAEVVIGADDFRQYLLRPPVGSRQHSRAMLEKWPKLVLELYSENYSYLAAKIIDDRPEKFRQSLLLTLIDNSLGVSEERERKLATEPARRWLGNLNWFYHATRDSCPTPDVINQYRRMEVSQTPLLIVHGTLDLATPIENARELLKYFEIGKLITVDGGTHAASYQAATVDPSFLTYLSSFMNAPRPEEVFDEIPDQISLPPLDFEGDEEPSLFEQLCPDLAVVNQAD